MPKGTLTSEYDFLLKNSDFKRWYENIARGSLVTAHVWLRRVGWIQKKFGVSPETMAKMDSRKGANFIMDVVGTLEKEGKSGSYIAAFVKVLKSWMAFNEIQIQQKIKVRGRDELVRFADERTPTPDELRTILNTADLRARAACAIIAFAGTRIEVLGNYTGTDGLQLGDLPEMDIKDGKAEFESFPTMVKVRKTLSKNGNSYTTFLCEEGCGYLKEYLQWRMLKGEKLSAKSPIITPVHANLVGEFIRAINIGDLSNTAATVEQRW